MFYLFFDLKVYNLWSMILPFATNCGQGGGCTFAVQLRPAQSPSFISRWWHQRYNSCVVFSFLFSFLITVVLTGKNKGNKLKKLTSSFCSTWIKNTQKEGWFASSLYQTQKIYITIPKHMCCRFLQITPFPCSTLYTIFPEELTVSVFFVRESFNCCFLNSCNLKSRLSYTLFHFLISLLFPLSVFDLVY